MTEYYVLWIMSTVVEASEKRGISSSGFWDWLGNVKFIEDNDELTSERAYYISLNLHELISEYKKANG